MIKYVFTAPVGAGLRQTVILPMIAAGGFSRVAVVGSALECGVWLHGLDGQIGRPDIAVTTFNGFHHKGLPFDAGSDLSGNDLIVVDELQAWQLEKIIDKLKDSPAQVWLINPHPMAVSFSKVGSYTHVDLRFDGMESREVGGHA